MNDVVSFASSRQGVACCSAVLHSANCCLTRVIFLLRGLVAANRCSGSKIGEEVGVSKEGVPDSLLLLLKVASTNHLSISLFKYFYLSNTLANF